MTAISMGMSLGAVADEWTIHKGAVSTLHAKANAIHIDQQSGAESNDYSWAQLPLRLKKDTGFVIKFDWAIARAT